MSASMCSDRHLTALAAYAVRHNLDGIFAEASTRERVDEIYGVLARENAASLVARVAGDQGHGIGAVDVRAAEQTLPPMHIIKACHCYAYQACGHEAWPDSRAKRLVEDIERCAVRELPGYADAPWGLE